MAGFISVPLLSTFNDAGVKQAERSLAGLGSAVKGLGASLKATAVSMVAFQVVQGGLAAIAGMVTQARDLQRNLMGMSYVFGQLTPQMLDFVKSANMMGLSQNEAAQSATFLGSVLRGAGFDTQTAANETKKLVSLASDLATVYGYDVSEALTGMTALFRGEYDPIEKFGVAIKQQQVNAELAARGLKGLTGVALLHAQQQVRLDLLYQRTTASMGAFSKQSGTLFVEQKRLEGAWTDLQAAMGAPLQGVLAQLAYGLRTALQGASGMGTRIGQVLADIGTALAPLFEPLMQLGGIVGDLFVTVLEALTPFVQMISGILTPALKIVVPIIGAVGEVLKFVVQVVSGLVTPAFTMLELLIVGILKVIAGALGAMADFIKPVAGFFGDLGKAFVKGAKDFQNFANGVAGITTNNKKLDFNMADLFNFKFNTTPAATTTTKNAVKDFYATMADEVKKQNARLKLESLGASAGLIEKILGTAGWEKVYAKLVAGGASAVSALQKTFNKTRDGLNELKAASDAAQKALDEYNAKVEAVSGNINDLAKSMADVLRSIAPLPTVTRQLGDFEQAVVDSFQSIYDTLKQAVDNKVLYQSSADDLAAYAKNTQTTLQGIAKERDAIAKKIQDANSLIDSTKNAVLGFVNLNDLLQTTSQTVTEQTVSMIDGIRLTLTRSFDIQKTTGDLAKGFQDILDRTKKFAQQLKSLKAMGLDKGLFQQIVSAGLDAGSATADAILQGGQGTVDELNGLFGELQSVGADVAETTAQVMYGAGVDVTNGLIAGLLSQSDQLAQAAQTLADAFTTSFNTKLADAMNNDAWLIANLTQPDTSGLDPLAMSSGGGSGMGGRLMSASVKPGSTYNINVQAGISDPAAVSQAVVNSIIRYERTNGAVWARV